MASHSERLSNPTAGFSKGQIVILTSDSNVRGAIVDMDMTGTETRYDVFIDGKIRNLYASQLALEQNETAEPSVLPLEAFHAYLTALQIRHPGLNNLYSLNAARIDFIPYQFRPVLKFIRSDRPRLLIADEVGVGKTIEAGLILRELQARQDVNSVLIICPRPLVTERKWEREMRRFDERFVHLDGPALRLCFDEMDREGVWPDEYQKVIMPFSLFDEALLFGAGGRQRGRKRRHKGLLSLDPPPRFDLVIIDEAHKIRNPETFTHMGVRFFCEHADAVLFLTATPLQLRSDELFVLLNVLRPDRVIDRESFAYLAAPNAYINLAVSIVRNREPEWTEKAEKALEEAGRTAIGQTMLVKNPDFNRVCRILQRESITQEDRVELIHDIEQLHTFSDMINRTRRRDIGAFTIRKSETVTVPFTPVQKALHDDVLRIQAEIMARLHSEISINFLLSTIRRQIASSLFGLAPFLKHILTRRLGEFAWEEIDPIGALPGQEDIHPLEADIRSIIDRAEQLTDEDPKLETLCSIIQDKQTLDNNKIMLFSSFRHTLAYLYEQLKSRGIRVGMVHGDTPDEERIALRERFTADREGAHALDVLLFSEVGCEGLDYQFCDALVNYDLPWNPMRIEQRIGRIDRFGQKSETIAIYNMITPGTIDAEIYDRCLSRIGVFEHAIGGCEEILGEITQEIHHIAGNMSLSEEEQTKKLQQLSDNQIGLLREQERLEAKESELFGLHVPKDQYQKDIDKASSFWLTPKALRNLVDSYLQVLRPSDQSYIPGEKEPKTLRVPQELRQFLLKDFSALSPRRTIMYRDWGRWLRGNEPYLSITFDADVAVRFPDAAFVMPLHPLVAQAAQACDYSEPVFTAVKVVDTDHPPGDYPFALYQWHYLGIKEDVAFHPIVLSDADSLDMGKLLSQAESVSSSNKKDLASEEKKALEDAHYRKWHEARQNHKRDTSQTAQYRRESLTTSHNARRAQLMEQLETATDERIQRMRRSQIASADAEYERRIIEIDGAVNRADIVSKMVATGIVTMGKG